MKKRIGICILAAFLISHSAGAAPAVEVNGEKIDIDAVVIGDRTYVPLRGVFEKAGASVSWNEETRTASVDMQNFSDDNLIPAIVESVSPSIVGIIGREKTESLYGASEGIAHGSGIVIKSGGEIVTNAHVVKNMQAIMVVMNDGKGYEAQLKYIDEPSDIAVIKINKIGLPTAKFADGGDIVVGRKVIAIGTPINFSLRNSATVGYISGINRGGDYYKTIQTDATINPGNSGGALVNMNGEVIGITSTGYLGMNTSFAIPSDTVRYVLNQFESFGRVRRPYFKASFKEDWLASIGVPSEAGLTIKSTESGSPLSDAGFKAGDVLLSLDGTSVNSLVELNEKLKGYNPGDSVKAGISSGGQVKYADIILAEEPQKDK